MILYNFTHMAIVGVKGLMSAVTTVLSGTVSETRQPQNDLPLTWRTVLYSEQTLFRIVITVLSVCRQSVRNACVMPLELFRDVLDGAVK